MVDDLAEARSDQLDFSRRLRGGGDLGARAAEFDERCWRRLWRELEAPKRERLLAALEEIMATHADGRLVEDALWARDLCRGFDADELNGEDLLLVERPHADEPGWAQLLRSIRSRRALRRAVREGAQAALELQLRIRDDTRDSLPAGEVGRFLGRTNETISALRAIVAYLERGEAVKLATSVAYRALRSVWQGLPAGERALVMAALFDDGALIARAEARDWSSQEDFLEDLGRHVDRFGAD